MTQKIRPMLAAQEYDPAITQKHLDTDGMIYAQPKIDGFRYLFDNGVARSRSWKEWSHLAVQSFAKQEAELIDGWDGEGTPGHEYSKDGFREAMSSLRAADGSGVFTFWLFDNFHPSWASFTYQARLLSCWGDLSGNIPEDCWTAQDLVLNTWDTPERRFKGLDYDVKVKLCPTFELKSLIEVEEFYEGCLARGWEGAILRRQGRGYKWNRSTTLEGSLTKIKPEDSFEVQITGFEPRYKNNNEAQISALGYTVRTAHQGNLEAMECLGAFVGHVYGKPEIPCKVGVLRGLSMGDKERIWRERDSYLGKIIQCVEHGYKGGYDAPRTPVFAGFRPIEEMDEPDGTQVT